MGAFISSRNFQLWGYDVSHRHLLIRSPRGAVEGTNVDILFIGVDYLTTGVSFPGIELRLATPEEVAALPHDRNAHDHRVFMLISRSEMFAISAAFAFIYENVLDIFEPIWNHFGVMAESNAERGRLLARL